MKASPAPRSESELAFEATQSPSSAKDSELEVRDCGAAVAGYDPVVSCLAPRPKFLRYDPNRRSEVLRRMQSFEESDSSSSRTDSSSSMEGLDLISCRSEELSDDDQAAVLPEAIGLPCSTIESPQEVESPLVVGVGEPTAQVVVEGLEEEDDDDDDDEEDQERSWWRPGLVLESLLGLGLLVILAPFFVSYVRSTSGVTLGEGGLGEGGLLEIHDTLHIHQDLVLGS